MVTEPQCWILISEDGCPPATAARVPSTGLGRRQPCLGPPRVGGPHLGQTFTHSRAAVYNY